MVKLLPNISIPSRRNPYSISRPVQERILPESTIRRAREIGLAEGLRYVYGGNLSGERGANTLCYACGALLIERGGLVLIQNRLSDGKCPECGTTINGVGM